MPDESWSNLAAKLDSPKPKRNYVRRKPILLSPEPPPSLVKNRDRSAERRTQLERYKAAEAREAAWEIMMTERIRTESAVIRAENDERHRIEGTRSSYNPRQPKIHGIGNLLPPSIDFS